jgi:hypothetical protein
MDYVYVKLPLCVTVRVLAVTHVCSYNIPKSCSLVLVRRSARMSVADDVYTPKEVTDLALRIGPTEYVFVFCTDLRT